VGAEPPHRHFPQHRKMTLIASAIVDRGPGTQATIIA
jgi:hypothetical protein